MKLFNIATIVAVTGIAQVLAVPLLVIPSSNDVAVVHPGKQPEFVGKMKKGPCRAGRYRQKAVEVSNIFREAFGLPLIKSGIHHLKLDGKVEILPFIGTPPSVVHGKDKEGVTEFSTFDIPKEDDGVHRHHHHAHGRHRHRKGHHHHRFGKGSFLSRVQYSIMNLGPWEGRSVAFVLGCGIGVLLRMLFVLTVVTFRAMKGREQDEHEYSQITIIEEFVDGSSKSAPPSYGDEKVPVVEVYEPKPSYVSENYPIVVEEGVKAGEELK